MKDSRAYVAARFVGSHSYLILWTDETSKDALRQTGRWASDKQFNFSWYDAAIMAGSIRRKAEKLSRRMEHAGTDQDSQGGQAGNQNR